MYIGRQALLSGCTHLVSWNLEWNVLQSQIRSMKKLVHGFGHFSFFSQVLIHLFFFFLSTQSENKSSLNIRTRLTHFECHSGCFCGRATLTCMGLLLYVKQQIKRGFIFYRLLFLSFPGPSEKIILWCGTEEKAKKMVFKCRHSCASRRPVKNARLQSQKEKPVWKKHDNF